MNRGDKFVAISVLVALAPLGVACSAASDPGQEAVTPTEQAVTTTTYETAFQGKNGNLWEDGQLWSGDTRGAIVPGSSPSIAATNGGGYRVAFQGYPQNILWLSSTKNKSSTNTGYGMKAGTSPSITGLLDGKIDSYEVAFQANTGELWVTGTAGWGPTGYLVNAGTSPSITALPGGGYEVAYQAPPDTRGDCYLHTYGMLDVRNTGLGMKAGTSPSIAALSTGGYEIAFQANTGELWVTGSAGGGPTGYMVNAGTSPSITALPGGGYEVAFQAPPDSWGNCFLYIHGTSGSGNTWLGMKAGTTPSITAVPGGGYQIAFQDNTGYLYYTGAQTNKRSTALLGNASSPSIAPVFAAPTGLGVKANVLDCITMTLSSWWDTDTRVDHYVATQNCNGTVATKTVPPNPHGQTDVYWSNRGYSLSCTYTASACYANGMCATSSKPYKTPAKDPSCSGGGGGGSTNTGSVGVTYYTALSSNLNCNSLTMTGTLSPGGFASNSSVGALTSSSNCPSIQNPALMQCCTFYLGAGSLAAGSYTLTTNVCSNAQTFYLATGQSKQFVGKETCPTPIN